MARDKFSVAELNKMFSDAINQAPKANNGGVNLKERILQMAKRVRK